IFFAAGPSFLRSAADP
ncbi:hypothetical protein Goarm_019422, partial [Gossypium armourianum]|nr:hypothetical protein [Gossypium lobatum]MBA0579813.1 hypothetical protein [Gossypium raimondii]MBA0822633.1 hypothetical protein [Gossypium armourianum]